MLLRFSSSFFIRNRPTGPHISSARYMPIARLLPLAIRSKATESTLGVANGLPAYAPIFSRLLSSADAPGAKKVNPEDIPPTSLQFMVEMSCGKCVAAVESAVAAVPGVEAVTAALETNTVRVLARLSHADDVIDV